MSDHDDKAALRRSIRAGREATTGEWRDRAAAEVIERLVGLLDDRVATVMSYLAFGAELDLGGLHDRVLAGGGRLVVPRVHGRLIEPVEYRDDIELVTSRFGIAEPVGEPVDPYSIDVVLVPAVCFECP